MANWLVLAPALLIATAALMGALPSSRVAPEAPVVSDLTENLTSVPVASPTVTGRGPLKFVGTLGGTE